MFLFGRPNIEKLKRKKDVKGLIKVLIDQSIDRSIRSGASKALGEIGDKRAVEPLIQALKDGDGVVRRESAWALGEIGDPRGAEPLIHLYNVESGNVMLAVIASSLVKIGEPAVEPLVNAIKNNKIERMRGIVALVEMGDKRAEQFLKEEMKKGGTLIERGVDYDAHHDLREVAKELLKDLKEKRKEKRERKRRLREIEKMQEDLARDTAGTVFYARMDDIGVFWIDGEILKPRNAQALISHELGRDRCVYVRWGVDDYDAKIGRIKKLVCTTDDALDLINEVLSGGRWFRK